MDTSYSQWVSRWQAALDACKRKRGETRELVIMPPASEEAVVQAEAELGLTLPPSFRAVLLEFAAQVDTAWSLPDEAVLPPELEEIFRGHCEWSFEDVVELNVWLKDFLLEEGDDFSEDWHNALLFNHVPNGDYLAFDLRITPDPPVIYLSHEEDEGQARRLGDNFVDFMERWSLLGCPGNEDWQMMPFLSDAISDLDAYGENARKWREWFGLDFEVNP